LWAFWQSAVKTGFRNPKGNSELTSITQVPLVSSEFIF